MPEPTNSEAARVYQHFREIFGGEPRGRAGPRRPGAHAERPPEASRSRRVATRRRSARLSTA